MDRRGSVCEKHGEYSPSGICRWCDPVTASSPPATGMLPASKEPPIFGAAALLKERYATVRLPAQDPTFMGIPIRDGTTAPLIPKHPFPWWAIARGLDESYYGGCACGAFCVTEDPRFAFLCGLGVRHTAFACAPYRIAPVASEGPQAGSRFGEAIWGKP